jgi:hypothetical protein
LDTPPGRCASAVVVPSPDRYSYGIINDHTVVVHRSNREIVHSC